MGAARKWIVERRGGLRPRAFTIVEILVVVAILMMIASVATIQLLRARITTYEQLALSSLRQIAKGCHYYLVVRQTFPGTLSDLGPPNSNPPFLDPSLTVATPVKQGYVFTYDAADPATGFTLRADPQQHGTTGIRHFYVDQQMAIHATDQNRDATPADPTIP